MLSKLKYMKKLILFGLITILFIGCADSTSIQECITTSPYGFWSGLWHGFITPITFIGSLFIDNVAVYGVNNSGGWYDFGFLLGVGGLGFSGGKVNI